MSSDHNQKHLGYNTTVTLIDTVTPLIADLLKKTEKISKDTEEIKSTLRRLRN